MQMNQQAASAADGKTNLEKGKAFLAGSKR